MPQSGPANADPSGADPNSADSTIAATRSVNPSNAEPTRPSSSPPSASVNIAPPSPNAASLSRPQWRTVWGIFLTILFIYIGVIYVGAQVPPTIAGTNTRVPVGPYAEVSFPEGWQILPVGHQGLAVARHEDQWIRVWAIEIDRELTEPDPTVEDRQRRMDRVFYTPNGLCPAEKMSSGSAVAPLLPESSNADQPSSGRSVQLTAIACGCGDECAQDVADSLHGELKR